MRKIIAAMFATLFVVGLSGAAWADCPYSHGDKAETTKDQQTS